MQSSFPSCHQYNVKQATVKGIILTRRIYNDFTKLTSLRVPKVTISTHSQRSIGQYMYRFLYNNFDFNDRFLLVNSLELALRYIYMALAVVLSFVSCVPGNRMAVIP